MHDVGESYLYSRAHAPAHDLRYFMPPLLLLAIPEWLARLLVGEGRAYAAMRWLTRPVVAAVLFNLVVMVTHVPGVVNHLGRERAAALRACTRCSCCRLSACGCRCAARSRSCA